MNTYNKKIILMDLDGVLINSIKNMQVSWENTCVRFNINHGFEKYKKLLGLPFFNILKKFNLDNKKYLKIKKNYDYISIKNISLIKTYPGVTQTLKHLKKNGFVLGLITSKDLKRTKKIIDKFNLSFKFIYTPHKRIRSKPYPDQIYEILKLEKAKNKDCIYVGDMILDKNFAKKAGVKFIYARYGYEMKKIKCKHEIKKFSDLKKILKNVF